VASRIAISRWRSLRSRARAYLRHGASDATPEPSPDTVVVYERFAGDDSLVFAHDVDAVELSAGGPDAPLATYLSAVVRVGDLVTFLDWNEPAVEPTEVRRLATRAASWLCVAANPPC
jgi:hypothetical protein